MHTLTEGVMEVDHCSNSLPTMSCSDDKKRKVCYAYDGEFGYHYYGRNHVMKPLRVSMTYALLQSYGVFQSDGAIDVFKPDPATIIDLCSFHTVDYVDFLSTVTPDNQFDAHHSISTMRFNFDADCPVIDDLFGLCQLSAGGSLCAAAKLNSGAYDIAINWSGGLHHAKHNQASGFCYVNDAVLGIYELLKTCSRVLYVDIDVHHGDGVEEAFFESHRVMTVSFHKFGENYFPETGSITDIGYSQGKYYSVNVPLESGMNDESYLSVFKPVMDKVMQVFQPGAVVLQCGADSLSGDKLGQFNLSSKGHARCVRYMRSFNVPMLMVGGGGYTIQNVSRCWAYETGVAAGLELDHNIPEHKYSEFYGPHYGLHVPAKKNMKNKNTRKKLEDLKNKILENLSKIQHVPSVQFSERQLEVELQSDQRDQEVDEMKM